MSIPLFPVAASPCTRMPAARSVRPLALHAARGVGAATGSLHERAADMTTALTLADHRALVTRAACAYVDAVATTSANHDWMERAKWQINLERAVEAYRAAEAALVRGVA